MRIKLADFGFAKIDRGDLVTPQFTPYYVSPQVFSDFPYFVYGGRLQVTVSENPIGAGRG